MDIDALIERLRRCNVSPDFASDIAFHTNVFVEVADALVELRDDLIIANGHGNTAIEEWERANAEIAKLREALEQIADGYAVPEIPMARKIARAALGEKP